MDLLTVVSQYGAAGLVIYLIARPLISHLITSNKEKDAYIQRLISEHFKNDEERHTAMLETLRELPRSIMKAIKHKTK